MSQTTPAGTRTGANPAASVASRDLLLVGLAILALVVAAFALPPLVPTAAEAGPGNGTDGSTPEQVDADSQTDAGNDERTPAGGNPTPAEDVSVRAGNASGGDGGVNVTGEDPRAECVLVVWDRLVPGRDATVLVWYDRTPAEDLQVWFEGRHVGSTSAAGRVDGVVPYVRRLSVTAEAPPVDRCGVVTLGMDTGLDAWREARGGSVDVVIEDEDALETVEPVDGNLTATVPVRATPAVRVENATGGDGTPPTRTDGPSPRLDAGPLQAGTITTAEDPAGRDRGDAFYPGETVGLNATIGGVPMANATVTANGERVGRTDGAGRYDLTVPDGTESVDVAVTRGEFTAETTLSVLLLSIDLRPDGILAVPGGTATVSATVGNRPAGGVTVSIDDPVATTGPSGRATLHLPLDPRATVVAEGHGQRTAVPVWPLYLPTAIAAFLAVGFAVASVHRASGREAGPTARTVAGLWAAVALVAAAWAVASGPGAAAAGAFALLAVLVRHRRAAAGVVDQFRARLASLAADVQRALIWVADRLAAAVDLGGKLARGLAAWLRGAPSALRGLVAGGWGGLAGLPGVVVRRVAAALGSGVRAVRALVGRLRRSRGGEAGAPTADQSGPAVAGGRSSPAGAETEPSLRQLWRSFARQVVPGRWQSRTPGEVARSAIERGFPGGPVQQLTRAFREVEYGDRPHSDERYRRARAAFEELRDARADEEGDGQ